jgi:hypothetical protein
MVIGDKVRMLHSHGEGVVTKVEGEMAVVMLSQGIEIPVPKKHLVVVATRQEAAQVQKAGTQGKPMLENKNTGMLFLQEGLYLAGIPRSPMLLDFFLVNQSDFQLSVLVYKLARPTHQFHAHIIVGPKSVEAIEGTFPKQESNHQLGLAFQFLKFHPSRGNPTRPGEYRLAFSQIPWEKTRQRIPLLEKEGYLIQLDGEPVLADPEKLRESMLQGQSGKQEPIAKPERRMAFREVDLHIEKLSDSITFIDRGHVIASRGRDEFLDEWRRIRLQAPVDWQLPVLPGIRLESQFRSQRVLSFDHFDQSVLDALQTSGATLEGVERMTLEEIFVSCVMRGREEASK